MARFRLDLRVVCEEPAGKNLHDDYHDYPDDKMGIPVHYVILECHRCGKVFTM